MLAPKSVLRDLRNIQRKFLWSGTQDPHEWALVNWDSVCKPKSQGGLGLTDPEKAGLIVGAKLWWHRLTHSQEPWAKLWVAKYPPHWDC